MDGRNAKELERLAYIVRHGLPITHPIVQKMLEKLSISAQELQDFIHKQGV